jgi:hypothetical protein
MKKNPLQLMVAIGMGAAFVSCSKDLLSYEEVQKQSYASNFVKKYGNINPNQTWDFTTGENQLATRGVSSPQIEIMENGIDFGDVLPQELLPKVRPRVDEQTHTVNLHVGGGAQPFVTRVGGTAHLTVASHHGNALRSACAQECYLHHIQSINRRQRYTFFGRGRRSPSS